MGGAAYILLVEWKTAAANNDFTEKRKRTHNALTQNIVHACTVSRIHTHSRTTDTQTKHAHTFSVGRSHDTICGNTQTRIRIRDTTRDWKAIAVGWALSCKRSQCSSDYVCVHMNKRSFCAKSVYCVIPEKEKRKYMRILGYRDVKEWFVI